MIVLMCTASQDDVDNSIHICDVNLMVTINIASSEITTTAQDDVNDSIYISNIDLVVTVHIANYATTTIS